MAPVLGGGKIELQDLKTGFRQRLTQLTLLILRSMTRLKEGLERMSERVAAKPDYSEADRAGLRRLSRLGHHGTLIRPHRSLDTLHFRGTMLYTVLLLPLFVTAAMAGGYDGLLTAWEWVLRLGLDRLEVVGSVERVAVPMLGGSLPVLIVQIHTWYPDAFVLWTTFAMVIAVMLASCYLPEWALPIAYILRAGCVVQAVSLLVFFLWPASFPYESPQHLRDIFALSVAFMGLVPWIHAVTYYIFNFGILRKIALTAYTLLFLACYAPVKILVHAYVLDRFSLLFMPILFLVFGVALDVFILIALYAWGMSWRPAQK